MPIKYYTSLFQDIPSTIELSSGSASSAGEVDAKEVEATEGTSEKTDPRQDSSADDEEIIESSQSQPLEDEK